MFKRRRIALGFSRQNSWAKSGPCHWSASVGVGPKKLVYHHLWNAEIAWNLQIAKTLLQASTKFRLFPPDTQQKGGDDLQKPITIYSNPPRIYSRRK